MNDTGGSVITTVRAWNEDGQLYLIVGIFSAIIAWIFVPVVGLIAVYCGYKLYATEDRKTSGAVIIVAGTVGVLTWIIYLFTIL